MLVLIPIQMWMWQQFFTFLNAVIYNFIYNILSLTKELCYAAVFLSDSAFYTACIQSLQADNATALVEFALSECFCLILLYFSLSLHKSAVYIQRPF